jgi:hypothetical protein
MDALAAGLTTLAFTLFMIPSFSKVDHGVLLILVFRYIEKFCSRLNPGRLQRLQVQRFFM